MRLNPTLSDAVRIFHELGWTEAELADAPSLPLGTPEQRKTALAGLRSGPWGEIGQVRSNAWGWISALTVNPSMLALFAVRVGVDAARTASILPGVTQVPEPISLAILAERGPAFAAAFIEAACRSNRRVWEHSSSVHGGLAVRLVAHHGIQVPENIQYLKDWAVFTLAVLTGERAELMPHNREVPSEAEVRPLFAEHARVAVDLGLAATGPFGQLLPAAVAAGWISREDAVEFAFTALDRAQRPGDRKRWAEILTQDLNAADAELLPRIDALVPVLASGEASVIEAFAPRMLAGAGTDYLADIALVSLLSTNRKAQRLVLNALGTLPVPTPDAIDALTPRLSELGADSDKAVSRGAAQLIAAWGITRVEPEQESVGTRGLWQATPQLWQVPAFDRGPFTAEDLTDAAAMLTAGPDTMVDIHTERFLAAVVAVSYADVEAARQALRGVGNRAPNGLRPVPSWLKGEPPQWGLDLADRAYEPLLARDFAVFQRLGELPCLLSTPSTVDLQVALPDLISRLVSYRDAGTAAVESDFLVALLRLDPSRSDASSIPADLSVAIQLQSGEQLRKNAGEIVRDYLADPWLEPALKQGNETWKRWRARPPRLPASLSTFPRRFKDSYASAVFDLAPHWGDSSLTSLGWYPFESGLGLLARQIARRATPLPPGGAINLLAIQRPHHQAAMADSATALREAWSRGLLLPGVADVTYLDWSGTPSNVAAFAAAMTEAAGDGLLSVVWPILDDLVVASIEAPRMIAGTADVVEAALALLPEVQAAIAAGLAPATALGLPGVRALAARSGSSRAVTLARQVVAGAGVAPSSSNPADGPTAQIATAAKVAKPAKPAKPFATLWPDSAGTLPAAVDSASLMIDWLDPDVPTRFLRFDLALPAIPDRTFRVVKGWTYDLENEGQCGAESRPVPDDGDVGVRHDAWLRWDAQARDLEVRSSRETSRDADGNRVPAPPLSTSLIAISIGLTSQDGDAGATGLYLVRNLLKSNLVGSTGVRIAVGKLLEHEAYSPAKTVRLMEGSPSSVALLWPLLTESVRVAQTFSKPPHWLNRVLDVSLLHAELLREAGQRGLIPGDAAAWPGLREIAERPGSTAALKKARALAEVLVD